MFPPSPHPKDTPTEKKITSMFIMKSQASTVYQENCKLQIKASNVSSVITSEGNSYRKKISMKVYHEIGIIISL